MRERTHVELVGIGKRYGDTVAVEHLSLEIPEGRFTTLLGPSGCGKTTTLRIIAGIYSPDSGRVIIEGTEVTDLPPQRRKTAMVFQEYALFPHLNVYGNIAYGLRRRRLQAADVAEKVKRVVEFLGLTALTGNAVNELSGGQQQRVALARALVVEPSVLLLDEPLSNLDAKIRIRIRTELKHIQQSLGKTTIYVTHDQEEALSISDYIALMNNGRLVQYGTPEEIYYRPVSRFAAEFVGTANLVEGVVEPDESGGCRITFSDGALLAASAPERPWERREATVLIRPESIALRKSPPDNATTLRGTVSDKSFVGGLTRYWTSTGKQTWVVDMPSLLFHAEPGERVWLDVDGRGVHLLND